MKQLACCGYLVLIIAAVLGAGCFTSAHNQKALQGWSIESPNFPIPKSISDDYHGYIQHLSADERQSINKYSVWIHKNALGQIAIEIKIPLRGTTREHYLIYDLNGRRIKTLKFKAGHYMS